MRKTAFSDKQLLQLEKPERYIGCELNSVVKDPAEVAIRFCICFPDVYEIGMSHLGIQILYDMFNRREDVWCERTYSPWVDADSMMRRDNIELFALESQESVRNFDFLGITIQYEMCYTNILQILDLSHIPLRSRMRGEEDPIVIGGGPCTCNPEPIADFFDMFYIGEGEVVYDRLFDLYRQIREKGGSRREFLEAAAGIEGIYVPCLYKDEYNEDGTLKSFTPLIPGLPGRVERQLVMDMDSVPYPERPVVPFIKVTQDRVVLEVMRGCIRGCRFCQAGQIYKPVRQRSLEYLKGKARACLESTGHEEISLSSLSTSDYTQLGELVEWLIENYSDKYVNISLPSLRIDSFSLDVMSRVQDVRKGSLTFAPEAGSQRMRDVINKGLTEEDIMRGLSEAFRGGWNRVKLYFMLGLPSETDEDVEAIAALANEVAACYFDTVPKEERKGIRVMVNLSASFFVPKPFTPFQWSAMDPPEEFLRKAYMVNESAERQMNHRSLKFKYHDSLTSQLEGVLARGDRRLSEVIEGAYRRGAVFDSWSELFDNDKWMSAFEESGLDIAFYTQRERGKDELFPWDFIDVGVDRAFLWREYEKSRRAEVTADCRKKCALCGAARYGGGVCFEDRSADRD